MSYPNLVEETIERFGKLPGIGRRSAERIAFWLLSHNAADAKALADSIIALKEGLQFCAQCNHLADETLCKVCKDQNRDHSTICVVEDPKDVIAIEKSGMYKGSYHVLLGSISPSDGRGPDELKIKHLIHRIEAGGIVEVILAMDADNEGEMTVLYLTKALRSLKVKLSRIGLGIPVGSSVEFADASTLGVSLNVRRELI